MKKSLLLFLLVWTSFAIGMGGPSPEETKAFFDALEAGNVSQVEKLGKENLLNIKNANGDTPLIAAVKKDDRPMVQELLRQIREIEGATPQTDIYFATDKNGQSALALAITGKNLEMVKTLLYYAPQSMDIDTKVDNFGNTPLILAMKTLDKKIVEEILAQAPNPDIGNDAGMLPENFGTQEAKDLLKIAKKRYNFLVHLYAAAGKADPITPEELRGIKDLITSDILSLNVVNLTRNPLVIAIGSGKLDLIKLLVSSIIDPTQVKNFVNQKLNGGMTPLLRATVLALNTGYQEDKDIVKFLLEKRANPDILPDIFYDHTPLSVALSLPDPEIAKLFIARGADINYQFSDKTTVLMRAVLNKRIDLVKTILALNPDLTTITNLKGENALELARRKFNTAAAVDKKKYEDIFNLLKKQEEAKRVPVTPTTPSDSKSLISVLANLTQGLKGLQKMLLKK